MINYMSFFGVNRRMLITYKFWSSYNSKLKQNRVRSVLTAAISPREFSSSSYPTIL